MSGLYDNNNQAETSEIEGEIPQTPPIAQLANMGPQDGALDFTGSEIVTFRLRAFIPNTLPSNPGYIRDVPNSPGDTMIPGPLPSFLGALTPSAIQAASDCYQTDGRGFTSDKNATSKVTTEFRLVMSSGQASVDPPTADLIHLGGVSTRLRCSDGVGIAQAQGSFGGVFGVRAIGNPAVGGDDVQIIGQAAIGNPHVVGAPMIDYSFDFIYNVPTHSLTFAITVGAFPAFELYAFRGSDSPTTILTLQPTAETAWGLIDAGVGINTSQYTGQVQL